MYFKTSVKYNNDNFDISVKIIKVSEQDISIIEVSDFGIIIYDTRINRKMVEDKFNYIEMIEITEEDFNKKIIEKLKKNRNENINSF